MAVKAKQRKKKARARRRPGAIVRIANSAESGIGIFPSDAFGRLADEWSYILRNRRRWSADEGLKAELRTRAKRDLGILGVEKSFLVTLADTRRVEVELLPWKGHGAAAGVNADAASRMPWEYMLSAATRDLGRYEPMWVTRLIAAKGRATENGKAATLLFVESEPGRLEGQYSFESERRRLKAAIGMDARMVLSLTESAAAIRRKVRKEEPDAVHVTGFDTHQVASLVEDYYTALRGRSGRRRDWLDRDGNLEDGMILRDKDRPERPVPYQELATLLINPAAPPRLVTLNLYHSAARMARACVQAGAHAALGFLDEIDDEVAEYFFQALYFAWREGNGHLGDAFETAWRKLSDTNSSLHGTSIVLWLAHTAFPQGSSRKTASVVPEPGPPSAADRQIVLQQTAALADCRMSDILQVELEVNNEVNYSLLHNARPLLNKLTISKLVSEPLEAIDITVDLNVGTASFPFRHTVLLLDEPQKALADLVTIPLTASLPRSLRERVHTTVYVKVCWNGRTAFEETRRVTLIPVDEWLDDTDKNPWLPSFVLPRDPAVQKIISSARGALIAIRDDPGASFEGYQAIDRRNTREPYRDVDAQVSAIWTTLVNDYRLQYINPPPSYSAQTQRLRTPTEVLRSNTGTCIDLSLLLASCLEYIDIYPVLVLLTGHCFVGYWRSERFHEEFQAVTRIPHDVSRPGSRSAQEAHEPFVERYGWRLRRLQFNEIVKHVRAGELVMLEATCLTSASSFIKAKKWGSENLEDRSEFDSLLDILLARSATPPVTPLPIIDADG